MGGIVESKVLELLKKDNYSFDELKEKLNFDDKKLNILLKRLLNEKIVFENDLKKYVFSKSNYVLNYIKHNTPSKNEICNCLNDIDKKELHLIIDSLLKERIIFLNYNNEYEFLKEDYKIVDIDRNSNNQSFVTIDNKKIDKNCKK